MADWEEEFEEQTTQTTTEVKKEIKNLEQESEDIIKPKIEYKAPSLEKKDDPNDYEKKWAEKNKELIERKKANELAVEGLDEKDKQKKLIDKRIIDDVSDFMNGGGPSKKDVVEEKTNLLSTEKDFIDLAVSNVSKIKAANKPSKFSYSYLKNSIDLLGPTLDGEKLDQLIKDLTVMFNKKIKGDKVNKPSSTTKAAKPQVSVGKGLERAEKMGAIDDFGGKDDLGEDEDYYEDDFI